jgi:hypothetical protein
MLAFRSPFLIIFALVLQADLVFATGKNEAKHYEAAGMYLDEGTNQVFDLEDVPISAIADSDFSCSETSVTAYDSLLCASTPLTVTETYCDQMLDVNNGFPYRLSFSSRINPTGIQGDPESVVNVPISIKIHKLDNSKSVCQNRTFLYQIPSTKPGYLQIKGSLNVITVDSQEVDSVYRELVIGDRFEAIIQLWASSQIISEVSNGSARLLVFPNQTDCSGTAQNPVYISKNVNGQDPFGSFLLAQTADDILVVNSQYGINASVKVVLGNGQQSNCLFLSNGTQ